MQMQNALMGSNMLVVNVSRKSNTGMPAIFSHGMAPRESEHTALVANMGISTTRHAVRRYVLKRSRTNAIDTSAMEMVEVRAARNNNVKNSTAQNRGMSM